MKTNNWEIVHKGKLVALEKETEKGFERAVRPPGVRLLLKNSEGKFLLTKEFRHEQNIVDVRLPGGKVFDSLDEYLVVRGDSEKMLEAAQSAAKLEAKQEAGVTIENVELVSKSSCGATVEWDLYYFTADILDIGEQELDGEEALHGIETEFYSSEEIIALIKNGDIKEDRSVAVLVKLLF